MNLILGPLDRQQWYCATSTSTLSLSAGIGLLILLCSLTGCATLEGRPELNPDQWAPARVTDEWVPTRGLARQYIVEETRSHLPRW